MAGSLRERSPGVWELRAFVGKDPSTGKPRQQSTTFRGGRRQAERALAALVAQTSKTKTVAAHTTVGHLLERWVAELERLGSSPVYVFNARYAIDHRLLPEFGNIKLSALSAEHLDRFYGKMKAAGLAPGTIHLHHNYMRAALSLGVRWEWIEKSPMGQASPPLLTSRVSAPPSVPEVLRLIAQAVDMNPDLGSLVLVAASTGLRRGELCGLRWSDIDIEHATLVVTRSAANLQGRTIVKPPKSNKARRLSLDDLTCAILDGHRVRCEDRWTLDPDAYVWSYVPGNVEPINPNTATNFFIDVRNRCELRHVRLHDLRHFSVTTLLTAGVDVRTVSGRHGHLNPTMTLGRYGHFMQSADVEAAKIMGALLRPAMLAPTEV